MVVFMMFLMWGCWPPPRHGAAGGGGYG